MKPWFAFGAVALLFAALPYATFAKSNAVQQEIATARAHALMASGAGSLKMTHAHLHHVVNCLTGPKGAGFDAAAADPCKGMGNGAMSDAGKDSKLQSILENALRTAEVGIKANRLKMAQQAAKKTAEILATAHNAR